MTVKQAREPLHPAIIPADTAPPPVDYGAAVAARHCFVVFGPAGDVGRFTTIDCAARTVSHNGPGFYCTNVETGEMWTLADCRKELS